MNKRTKQLSFKIPLLNKNVLISLTPKKSGWISYSRPTRRHPNTRFRHLHYLDFYQTFYRNYKFYSYTAIFGRLGVTIGMFGKKL